MALTARHLTLASRCLPFRCRSFVHVGSSARCLELLDPRLQRRLLDFETVCAYERAGQYEGGDARNSRHHSCSAFVGGVDTFERSTRLAAMSSELFSEHSEELAMSERPRK